MCSLSSTHTKQAAAKLASGLVSTVWHVVDDMVVTPSLQVRRVCMRVCVVQHALNQPMGVYACIYVREYICACAGRLQEA